MEVVLLTAAVFFVCFGVGLLVMKLRCNQEITGVFVRSHELTVGGANICTPVFRYELDSVVYEGAAAESFSCLKLGQLSEGESYSIYVNQKRPEHFLLGRKLRLDDVGLIVLGLFFAVIGLTS